VILCETDYRREIEQLQRYSEDLLATRDPDEVQTIEGRRYTLIREVCDWILKRPRTPGCGATDFLVFLQGMEERCNLNAEKVQRKRGNTTNHPGRRLQTDA